MENFLQCIVAEAKWPSFCRQQFQLHFPVWKLDFDYRSLFLNAQLTIIHHWLGQRLCAVQQANTRTNDNPYPRRMCASPGFNELIAWYKWAVELIIIVITAYPTYRVYVWTSEMDFAVNDNSQNTMLQMLCRTLHNTIQFPASSRRVSSLKVSFKYIKYIQIMPTNYVQN